MEDTKKLAQDIVTRFRSLERTNERASWDSTAEEIEKYIIPRRGYGEEPAERGQRTDKHIFDYTAVESSQRMADGLQGNLITPRQKWFRFKTGIKVDGKDIDDLAEVRHWLQDTENVVYTAINRSNLYEAMSEFFLDGVTLAIATIYSEWDWEESKPVFTAINPKEVYIDENERGEVDTVFRKYWITARVAYREFGEELGEDTVRLAKKNPAKLLEFLHAVYPREERDRFKSNAKNKRYASVWVYLAKSKVVRDSGFDRIPYAVWRYRKNSGEIYGRGPAHDHLSTVILANTVAKRLTKITQEVGDPVLMVPEHMKDSFRRLPGQINYYSETEAQGKAYALPLTGDYGVVKDYLLQLQQAIRKAFFHDFFLMLSSSEREMTATEIMERQGEKATILGPAMGRLNSEALSPLIKLVYYQCLRAGQIPPAPEVLAQYAGKPIDIDFLGPLQQMQDRYLSGVPIENSLQKILPLIQLNNELADLINWDEAGYELLEAESMPQGVMNDRKKVKLLRARRAEAMQAQQQAQAQMLMADQYEKLKGKPEKGSPAEQSMRAAEQGAGEAGG